MKNTLVSEKVKKIEELENKLEELKEQMINIIDNAESGTNNDDLYLDIDNQINELKEQIWNLTYLD